MCAPLFAAAITSSDMIIFSEYCICGEQTVECRTHAQKEKSIPQQYASCLSLTRNLKGMTHPTIQLTPSFSLLPCKLFLYLSNNYNQEIVLALHPPYKDVDSSALRMSVVKKRIISKNPSTSWTEKIRQC